MFNVQCSPRRSRGVALIVTLIMLAVITFMATTFLVLSRRERNSVSTNTDQTTARFTADTAVERAKAQLLAGVIATGNDQNFDLMVPTNFFNPYGFNTTLLNFDPTNVNYNYRSIGGPLTAPDQIQNIANLLYDPRAPVYITNAKVTNDFRYYLDLNRNGLFDDTGSISNVYRDTLSGSLVTNGLISVIGDPQWIGVLQFPDRPHSADNKFVSRWTYIVLPAGKTLDVNYLHNQTRNTALTTDDGFVRNQGVGTWELNLAAFLGDLNTNIWNADSGTTPNYYQYNRATLGILNKGVAFDDARALLAWRYGSTYNSLASASAMFPNGAAAFVADNIDEYSDGPFMYGTGYSEALLPDPVLTPWAGADNTNHFFTTQDFFDPNKTSAGFYNRLAGEGFFPESYRRYTFYRMLAQLGTDSSPPAEDKININYRNVTNGVVTAGMETNLYAWTPLEFFTNSAARMFEKLNLRDRDGYLISVTNIPIWPTTNNNYYTPAVHRVLQLAANIFEATTNTLYPCIYRPLFSARGTPATNIFISGYELVNGADNRATDQAQFMTIPLDMGNTNDRAMILSAPLPPGSRPNIYGAPWVIGARKGFPNLNQIAMQSVSQMTRKLLVYRPLTRSSWTGYQGKQMFVMGVSNSIAVEIWNSYNTVYPRPLYIQVDGKMTVELTNLTGNVAYRPAPVSFSLGGSVIGMGATNVVAGTMFGTGLSQLGVKKAINTRSFVVPFQTDVVVLQDSVQNGGGMVLANDSSALWNALPWDNLIDPHWGVNITNNIRCFVMDGGSAGRVVDYVQLSRLDRVRDLTHETLATGNKLGVWTPTANIAKVYWVNPGTMSEGLLQQIQISSGSVPTDETEWTEHGIATGTKTNATANFANFLIADTVGSNTIQAPFTPTSKIRQMVKWQANDPLVHYLSEDLTYLDEATNAVVQPPNNSKFPKVTDAMNRLNDRYSPWGGNVLRTGYDPADPAYPDTFNTALKDPLVTSSDSWNFPTNKFPSVGWLGRVHRGTPWQTAYMKSANILDSDVTTWQKWSGSGNLFLATNIAPIVDRQLFEVFTTALSDNATRGQLSINQTNLAAWSAVLSGVIVLTNDPASEILYPTIISPAGVFNPTILPLPPLAQIVQGINSTRTNFANQTFTNLGDILATPELTDMSPFLTNSANDIQANLQQISAGGISDEVMERIPQQVMSLLTISHSPRFVVYGYGQTLRPANSSIVIGGAFNGLCTNYEVTAETAVRAVMRVDGAPTNSHVIIEQYNVLPPD